MVPPRSGPEPRGRAAARHPVAHRADRRAVQAPTPQERSAQRELGRDPVGAWIHSDQTLLDKSKKGVRAVEPFEKVERLLPKLAGTRDSLANSTARLPEVAWRAGVDLNPIDVANPDQLAWLETLVWPEHTERRDRLHRAAALVAADRPHLVAGDIIDEIPALIGQAPTGSHVVVFHSAVLVYLTEERRSEFARLMQSMESVTWISNEGAGVLPFITEKVTEDIRGRTILARNGSPSRSSAPTVRASSDCSRRREHPLPFRATRSGTRGSASTCRLRERRGPSGFRAGCRSSCTSRWRMGGEARARRCPAQAERL
ncbi:hypothetical protein DEA06_05300 [Microbacterium sp. Gd 4-13]|nr:hypothetical protein DEA06_05300 [Microbacterium sp. Gd 4-13]